MKEFDVIIIGSGPGGYVCAIRSAQLGMSVAIVEKYPTLGGTCLNVGCIPSKAYLDSSEKYYELVHSFKEHGIMTNKPKIDWEQMKSRVEKVVSDTCSGVKYLMDKNKIQVFQGMGQFEDQNTVKIVGENEETIKGKHIVIATGSKPSSLPGIEIDKKRVITSTEALKLSEIPKHLVLIGGGVIGLELGSVYKRLGSEVTVVEYADSLIPMFDADMSKSLTKA